RKPEPLQEVSKLDEYGVIHLMRNNPWVNAWNPSIAITLWSNHDISFLATKTRSLAVIYYVTNYTTKEDVSSYKTISHAAILKRRAIEAEESSTNMEELIEARRLSNKFALRCFNQISQTREILGVQAASSLLRLPDHYTKTKKFRTISLNDLRLRVGLFMQRSRSTRSMTFPADEDGLEHEQYTMRPIT